MAKKKKQSKGKAVVKVIVPPVKSSVPDFTDRAINNSNSKRVRFLKAIDQLVPKVTKTAKTYGIDNLIGAEHVASSLPPKISRWLKLSEKGIVLRATKSEMVEGKKNSVVTEVSLVKG